jgi:hypothetical protein
MREAIFSALKPVRDRQRFNLLVRTTLWGLLAGALAGIVAGALRLTGVWAVSSAAALGIPVLGAAAGYMAGWIISRRWHDAAAAVDTHYQFKDRAVSALDFLAKNECGPMHELQIADTAEHLRQIDPRQVVLTRTPRRLAVGALCLCGAAALTLFWPLALPVVEGAPAPAPEHIVAEAMKIQDSLIELEKVAERGDDQKLAQLVADLKKIAEELTQPGVDEREALAKLSEMVAAVRSQMSQFNIAAMEAQMQSLGNALASAQAFEGAGKALMEAKLEKAAQELDKIDDPMLERKEAKTVEEKLKQVAKAASQAGMGSLSAAVSELADDLKGGGGKVNKGAVKELSKEIGNEARKRKVAELLRKELDLLADSKCNCSSSSNSLVKGQNPQKSTSPTNTFGMGTAGLSEGEKTKLQSQRKQESITGTQGDGPSDMETESSPEAKQLASRGYKEAYQKYRKESEAVLDSEPIPLGQRQLIRNYFELIRPQSGDANDKQALPNPK